jgi:hypothetical protein
MKGKSAVVVLVGRETSTRPWVLYEIQKAWNDKIPLLGISIHGLKDLAGKSDLAGTNPFSLVKDSLGRPLSSTIPLFTPSGADSKAVYSAIAANFTTYMNGGVKRQ